MGNGRKKIEIKKIENIQARSVCFSKRRKGLFKKASELSRLHPNHRIAAVVFSPSGKPYLYGDPLEFSSFFNAKLVSKPDNDRFSKIYSMLSLDDSFMGLDQLINYSNELKAARTELARLLDQKKLNEETRINGMTMSDSEIDAMVEDLLRVGDSENQITFADCSSSSSNNVVDCSVLEGFDINELLSMI